MSSVYLLVTVCLVAAVGCARTSVTAASRLPPHSPGGADGMVYDDTHRTVPAGQELDVRLQTPLSSKTVTVQERFHTTIASDLRNGSRVLVPAGSIVRGVVRGVDPAVGADGEGRLALSFTELIANGHSIRIDGTITQLFAHGGVRDERDSIATGQALTGGILAGLGDHLTTSVIAADGTVVAVQPGADAALPAGTILRVRMNVPVHIH